MAFPPPPQPVNRDLEELMDALAYILSTDAKTSDITWIVGDVGMGGPSKLPFGYISIFGESVKWYTAQGGTGGLPAPGQHGLDDWLQPIVLTVAFAPHQYQSPVAAKPPASSAYYPPSLGVATLPYLEQPGWRTGLELNQRIKSVLRENIVVASEAATTRITESRWVLQVINGKLYRASRIGVQSQQRRAR